MVNTKWGHQSFMKEININRVEEFLIKQKSDFKQCDD